jgi:YgiT-type zinc finger domain-containing protein
MTCHACGAKLRKTITDLPFKLKQGSIIIIKQLPVLQCGNCSEYLIQDVVMEKVDKLLTRVDTAVEVEILNYAA